MLSSGRTLGMRLAADLSHRLGLIDARAEERIQALLTQAGLPAEAPRIGAQRALELMRMDKKVLAGTIRLVLLDKLGGAVVTADYDRDALAATLGRYFA